MEGNKGQKPGGRRLGGHLPCPPPRQHHGGRRGVLGTAGFLGSPAEPPAGMKRTGEGVVVVRGGGSSEAARGGSPGAGGIGPASSPQPAGEWKVFPE